MRPIALLHKGRFTIGLWEAPWLGHLQEEQRPIKAFVNTRRVGLAVGIVVGAWESIVVDLGIARGPGKRNQQNPD